MESRWFFTELLTANSPLLKDIPCLLLMAGKPEQDAPKKMERARSTLEKAGFSVTTEIIPGDTETVIARTIKERQIDLLLMGAFNHSPLRKLFFGSRTNELLRSAKVPTLLLR